MAIKIARSSKNKSPKALSRVPLSRPFRPSKTLVAVTALVVAAVGIKQVFFSKAATNLVDTSGTDTSCVFQKADAPVQVAFCDGFNSPTVFDARFSRSGDLNGLIWGASRTIGTTSASQSQFNPWEATHIEGCGSTSQVQAPNDIRICNGRLYESINDGHSQTTLAMYPKQPFNFAGRTGTVSFDVSTDTHGGHGHWPEFWITDKPIPAPHGDVVSGQGVDIDNGVGFTLRIDKCHGDSALVSIDKIVAMRHHIQQEWNFDNFSSECIRKTSASDAQLNHFEFRVSQNTVEVWATNPGSTAMVLLGSVNNANLTLSQGLVWMNDVDYNAEKDGYPINQNPHTFAWDNLGFDGPKTYRDLAYDVPDNTAPATGHDPGAVNLGYHIGPNNPLSFTIPNVAWQQQPSSAIVTFNWGHHDADRLVPSVRANGGAWSNTPWPFAEDGTSAYRSIAIPIPLADVRSGLNTLEFKYAGISEMSLMNIDLILVAAAPVPGQVIASATPTAIPTVTPTATIAPTITPVVTLTPTLTPTPTPTPTPVCTKSGDTNCDGRVNSTDLQSVLANYGKPTSLRSQGDLTGDSQVNIFDLSQVLQNWGK